VLARARALTATVFARMQRQGVRACRTVTITVRFINFTTLTRSRTSREPLASEEALFTTALALLQPFFDHRENPKQRKIRLIGIRAENLLR
jgi:DNA polymerase-4